jgi:hypothetical protein
MAAESPQTRSMDPAALVHAVGRVLRPLENRLQRNVYWVFEEQDKQTEPQNEINSNKQPAMEVRRTCKDTVTTLLRLNRR